MNAGLAQGFVRFNTVAHEILLLLHEFGRMRHSDFVEELGSEKAANVSATLKRLHVFGFIHPCGKLSKYIARDARTQQVWSLEIPEKITDYKRASVRERTRRYRAAKKLQVASVFDWRGPRRKRKVNNAAPDGRSERGL